MKHLYLNGIKKKLEPEIDLLTFLEKEEMTNKKIAVAINGIVIQKKEYEKIILYNGDRIEIVHAVGGGK